MMSFQEINPLWRIVDPLTVSQAAALLAGVDPNYVTKDIEYFTNPETGFTDSAGITLVRTAFAALTNAILDRKLSAKVIHDSRSISDADSQCLMDMMECGEYYAPTYENLCEEGEVFENGRFIKKSANWDRTLVAVSELKEWLLNKGMREGFFFPDAINNEPDYLCPKNPRYAPKLAAAVRAWQSVTDAGGKHPKQALAKWLREHAAEFGMTDDEGKPNETGIEEAAKVANWQPGGGAPKTPGE
jgi:hypothetical protein